jgi:hypothetical protein
MIKLGLFFETQKRTSPPAEYLNSCKNSYFVKSSIPLSLIASEIGVQIGSIFPSSIPALSSNEEDSSKVVDSTISTRKDDSVGSVVVSVTLDVYPRLFDVCLA